MPDLTAKRRLVTILQKTLIQWENSEEIVEAIEALIEEKTAELESQVDRLNSEAVVSNRPIGMR